MTSHLGIYSPGLTTPFNTKTPTLESSEGAEMKMIQSDDYDDALIFFFSTPRLDVHHVASSSEASPSFEVRNRETLFCGLPRPGFGPIFYLGESEPNPPSHLNLGGGFEPKPPKPPSHAFAPCTRVGAPRWHPASPVHRSRLTVHRRAYTTVAEPPLHVPSSHGRPTPSIASGPLESFLP